MNIKQRISDICQQIGIQDDADVIHALSRAYRIGLRHVFGVKVGEDYYRLSLPERAITIGGICQNTEQLCKCLLYENCAAPKDAYDFSYSRYYCLIYQYTRKFSAAKFAVEFRTIAKTVNPALTKSAFKWKFVRPEVATELSGSEFNGMSFLGFAQEIPIVFDKAIEEECCFIGGLHPFTKVRVVIDEVCKELGAKRVPFTDERHDDGDEDDLDPGEVVE